MEYECAGCMGSRQCLVTLAEDIGRRFCLQLLLGIPFGSILILRLEAFLEWYTLLARLLELPFPINKLIGFTLMFLNIV